MKSFLFVGLFLFAIQHGSAQKKMFIRIFDGNGKKIERGVLTAVSDTSVTVLRHGTAVQLPVSRIGKIILRHSFGHTILLSSVITGGVIAILGAATAEPDASFIAYDAGEGAAGGALFGGAAGALIGTIIAGTRNRPVLLVNQSQENWSKVKTELERLVYHPAT